MKNIKNKSILSLALCLGVILSSGSFNPAYAEKPKYFTADKTQIYVPVWNNNMPLAEGHIEASYSGFAPYDYEGIFDPYKELKLKKNLNRYTKDKDGSRLYIKTAVDSKMNVFSVYGAMKAIPFVEGYSVPSEKYTTTIFTISGLGLDLFPSLYFKTLNLESLTFKLDLPESVDYITFRGPDTRLFVSFSKKEKEMADVRSQLNNYIVRRIVFNTHDIVVAQAYSASNNFFIMHFDYDTLAPLAVEYIIKDKDGKGTAVSKTFGEYDLLYNREKMNVFNDDFVNDMSKIPAAAFVKNAAFADSEEMVSKEINDFKIYGPEFLKAAKKAFIMHNDKKTSANSAEKDIQKELRSLIGKSVQEDSIKGFDLSLSGIN